MTDPARVDTMAFMEDPGNMNDLLEAIASGSTMVEFVRLNKLSYGAVCRFMMDDDRKARLASAREIRGEFLSDIVVRNLRAYNDFNIEDAYDASGNLLPIQGMPDNMRRAIASIQVTTNKETIGEGETASVAETTTTKITTVKLEKSVELLGKYRKMLTDRTELTGENGAPLVVFLPPNGRDEKEEPGE